MTNHHVVEGFSKIFVVDPSNRERQHPAKVIATQSNPDLALLELTSATTGPGATQPGAQPPTKSGRVVPAIVLADQMPGRGEGNVVGKADDNAQEKIDNEEKSEEDTPEKGSARRPRDVLTWPQVDARVSPSTVFIIGKTNE